MYKWSKLMVLVLLVLVTAMVVSHLAKASPAVANGTLPVPPTPWLVANGTLPVPPTPWQTANGTLPVPPTPWTQ